MGSCELKITIRLQKIQSRCIWPPMHFIIKPKVNLINNYIVTFHGHEFPQIVFRKETNKEMVEH